MTKREEKLIEAARFAVLNSGDHGCDWCKAQVFGCKQCLAYDLLVEALRHYKEIQEPSPTG